MAKIDGHKDVEAHAHEDGRYKVKYDHEIDAPNSSHGGG
jgi:hypothetical protein